MREAGVAEAEPSAVEGQAGLYNCAYIQIHMGTKTISIKDEVYDLLRRLKREDESFGDVISRLARAEAVDLEEFFGLLEDRTERLDGLAEDVRRIRELAKLRP